MFNKPNEPIEKKRTKVEKDILIFFGIFIIAPILLSILSPQFLSFIKTLFFALIPIFFALLIAISLKPLSNKLQKRFKNLTEAKAGMLTILILIFIIALFIAFAWNPISNDVKIFLQQIRSPSFIVQLSEQIEKFFPKFNAYQYLLTIKTQLSTFFSSNIENFIISGAKSTSTFILKLLLSFAIATYILIDYSKAEKLIKKTTITHPRWEIIIQDWKRGIKAWTRGWFKDQAFIFVTTLMLLLILGVQSAFTLSLIMTLLNFIPFIGPIIGGTIIIIYTIAIYLTIPTTLLFGFIEISSTLTIIMVSIGVTLIQTLESLWWIPKVYSAEANIHPVFILITLSLMSTLISPLITPFTIPLIIIFRSIYMEYFVKN